MAQLILRLGLACVFFSLGGLMLYYPAEGREYLHVRYESFSLFVHRYLTLPSFMRQLSFETMPHQALFGIAAVQMLAGLLVLLGIEKAINVIAFLTLILGGLLHVPYDDGGVKDFPNQQIRKLVLTLALFCSLMVCSGAIHTASKSKGKDKKKDDKDDKDNEKQKKD